VLACFCATNHQFATEEFLIVQFLDCAFGFLDRLHLNKGETFGTLIVSVTYHFGVLNMPDPVEELEEITFGGVE
jgi:hypothetical protein